MKPIRVIKIGGSLLQRERLLSDLQSWQDSLSDPMVNVWITGGGVAVDAIRKRCHAQGLSDSAAHWASIKAMDDNAAMLNRHLPNWQITDTSEKILQLADKLTNTPRNTQRSFSGAQQPVENWILQTHRWIESASAMLESEPQLPHSWDVTSDSIAAWVAIQLRASQLILLKSCLIPTERISELARLGIVDPYLPTLDLPRYATQFICECLPCTSHDLHEKITPNN